MPIVSYRADGNVGSNSYNAWSLLLPQTIKKSKACAQFLSLYLNARTRAKVTFYLFTIKYVQEGDSEVFTLFTVS